MEQVRTTSSRLPPVLAYVTVTCPIRALITSSGNGAEQEGSGDGLKN